MYFVYAHRASCNIAYLKLHGDFETYVPPDATSTDMTASDDLMRQIRQADSNLSIRAIVLEVDSPGGSGVAADETQATLKRVHKPTVALIRDMGTSAAYEAATGANVIFVAPESTVGGIGVTSSYVDNAAQDVQNGLTFHQLSIGAFKDTFNPDKPMTAAEQARVMGSLQKDYERFVSIVAANRNMPPNHVQQLADGWSYTGSAGLANGLIDKLGTIDDVRDYLTQKLGTTAVFCGVDE